MRRLTDGLLPLLVDVTAILAAGVVAVLVLWPLLAVGVPSGRLRPFLGRLRRPGRA